MLLGGGRRGGGDLLFSDTSEGKEGGKNFR